MEDSYFLISKANYKATESKLCCTGIQVYIKTNGTEQQAQKIIFDTWSSVFWQKCQGHSVGRGQSFQQMFLEKTGYLHAEE